jgi:hypothetical protein
MANTSGLINSVTVPASEMIQDALQDLRVIQDGASPTTGDTTDAIRKINFLLKKWATKGLMLWTLDTLIIPMGATKSFYTVGPVGADITSYRPLRALNGTFARQVSGGQNLDTQLTLLSRQEYMTLGNKGSQGVINAFYYDPQMSTTALGVSAPSTAYNPANSVGVFYFYVTPSDTTRTAYCQVQRPIQEITSGAQTFDLPLEWYEALTKNLAAALADKYEVPEARLIRIKQEAKMMLDEIADWGATEQAPVTFQPDYQMSVRSYG